MFGPRGPLQRAATERAAAPSSEEGPADRQPPEVQLRAAAALHQQPSEAQSSSSKDSTSLAARHTTAPLRGVKPVGWCPIPECSVTFYSWEGFVRHYIDFHVTREVATRICKQCLEWCPEGLRSHFTGHNRKNQYTVYDCGRCSANFFTKVALWEHRAAFHRLPGRAVPFGQCPSGGCEETFSSWGDCVKHFLANHLPSSESKNMCTLCLIDDRGDLKHKPNKHHEFVCQDCKGRFYRPYHLRSHHALYHAPLCVPRPPQMS